MHEEMLKYGLKMGTVNTLLPIDMVHSGLACNCVCPYCQKPLIARKGEIRQHHFAHDKGAECGKARMTALHMLAQNILARDKTIMLPDYYGKYYTKDAQSVKFDDVKLEVTSQMNEEKKLRPDCIGIKYDKDNAHQLWIEIYVTHEVEEEKEKYIKKSTNACIEIDLSDLLDTDYTDESVAKRLQESKDNRKWICCPKCDEKDTQLKQQKEHERQKLITMSQKLPTQLSAKKSNNIYSHFILYPNGEAIIVPLTDDAFENIAPSSESIYEVVVNAHDNFYTYHYCYDAGVKAVYKQNDCRTCKYRKYDEQHFNNRNLRIICDYTRNLPSRLLPPQYAIRCKYYEYDTGIFPLKRNLILKRIK